MGFSKFFSVHWKVTKLKLNWDEEPAELFGGLQQEDSL
jgi:hypothetical protein